MKGFSPTDSAIAAKTTFLLPCKLVFHLIYIPVTAVCEKCDVNNVYLLSTATTKTIITNSCSYLL